MKKTKAWVALFGVVLLVSISAYPQTRQTQPQAMAKWAGKYPDTKFFNQPLIKSPLRRLLSKEDYNSIGSYNLMIPIKKVGDYLVTYAVMKYSEPQETISLAFDLKDGAVYIIFWKGEQHRKFGSRDNRFDLPDEVLKEIGLKEAL